MMWRVIMMSGPYHIKEINQALVIRLHRPTPSCLPSRPACAGALSRAKKMTEAQSPAGGACPRMKRLLSDRWRKVA